MVQAVEHMFNHMICLHRTEKTTLIKLMYKSIKQINSINAL